MRACRVVVIAFFAFLPFGLTSPGHTMWSVDNYHFPIDSIAETSSSDDNGGGIREEIPAKYLERYQAWKNEFLATESGRQQWQRYATDPSLKLTITVTRDNAEGATTGKYKWNETVLLARQDPSGLIRVRPVKR